MNEEIRTKWVAALRSGQYKQGRLALRSQSNCFCCLGVLCDIVQPEGWSAGTGAGCLFFTHTDGSRQPALPPRSLLDAVGLSMQAADRLSALNDKGRTFEEIANVIESGSAEALTLNREPIKI